VNFKHLVGKSTLKEGITIHKGFENFFESPELGQKKNLHFYLGTTNQLMLYSGD
jgi:hypothetical protein